MKRKNIDVKILPVNNSVPFTYNGRLAFALAATLGEKNINEDVWNWIYSEFTQILCKKKIEPPIRHTFFHVYTPYNPFLKTKYSLRIKRLWVDPEKALDDVIAHISNDFFVNMRLDLQYIKAFEMQDGPKIHSEHIYGYDINEEKLYLLRFDYQKGMYSMCISFDEFKKAYTPMVGLNQKLINIYYKVNKEVSYKIKPKYVKKRLVNYVNNIFPIFDFLNTQIGQNLFAWDIPYGNAIGLSAMKYVKNVLQTEYEDDNCFTRYGRYIESRTRLQAVYEFKKLMFDRLTYLSNNSYIPFNTTTQDLIKKYKNICDNYLIIRNKYIKYQYTGQKKYLEDIINEIEYLQYTEKNVLEELLHFV